MRRALIGHTGFVGSNLDRQIAVTDRYNSRNFREIAGQSYDEVVCAGIQAVKWWANQNPAEDWAGIAPLLETLEQAEIKRFVLISTADVYRVPVGVERAGRLQLLWFEEGARLLPESIAVASEALARLAAHAQAMEGA